jgi:DNA helicase HerA-like ATPase
MTDRHHLGATPEMPATTRSIVPDVGSSLDPRTQEISWIAFQATGARVGLVSSTARLAEVLRGFADLLEKTYDGGRTAALTRLSTERDRAGRISLQLTLAVGVLGPKGETAEEAEACAAVAQAALARFPSPFSIERIDAASLLTAPDHVAVIRQRSAEVADQGDAARALSRFDRQLESWLDVAELLVSHPEPVIFQSSFLATSLSAAEGLEMEQESMVAGQIRDRAVAAGNHVLACRAERIVATLMDVSESYGASLWVGEIVVGSNSPLPRPFVRALATAVSNEVDVIHAQQGAPVVAGRARVVGGHAIEYPVTDASDALMIGLPRPALRHRSQADLYSLTEVAYVFRWPVPIGELPIPTIASLRWQQLPAPAGLATTGMRLGRDSSHREVFLGAEGLDSHMLLVGGTGSGKSTAMCEMAGFYLRAGKPFVVVDPHGDYADAIRAEAAALGKEVGLISANEPGTLSLDLLGGAKLGRGYRRQLRRALGRLIDALTSHFPRDWAGPRFRQLAMAALEVAVAAAGTRIVRLEDVARILIDREYLQLLLSETDSGHSETVLRQHMLDRDHADVGLWAASKFDDIAQSPGANRIFAAFLQGVSVEDVLSSGIPLVIDLSGLPRIAMELLGQVALAHTLDYALSREPGNREPFPVFVDEAHRFPAVNLVDALAEGRKFGLRLVLATQELGRLDPDLRDALITNTATKAVFRTGTRDSDWLSPLVGVPSGDLCGLTNLNAFVHMIGYAPFSISLDPPARVPELPPYKAPAIRRAADTERELALPTIAAAADARPPAQKTARIPSGVTVTPRPSHGTQLRLRFDLDGG